MQNAIILVGAGLFKTFTLWVLWGWFIVPLGAPGIGFVHMIGLVLFWALLTLDSDDMPQDEPFEMGTAFVACCLFVLLVGWILSYWQ